MSEPAIIAEALDAYWGLVHSPLTDPARMRVALAGVAQAIAATCPEENAAAVAHWLLGQIEGEAQLNRRMNTERRRIQYGFGPPVDRRTTIRRNTDPQES